MPPVDPVSLPGPGFTLAGYKTQVLAGIVICAGGVDVWRGCPMDAMPNATLKPAHPLPFLLSPLSSLIFLLALYLVYSLPLRVLPQVLILASHAHVHTHTHECVRM